MKQVKEREEEGSVVPVCFLSAPVADLILCTVVRRYPPCLLCLSLPHQLWLLSPLTLPKPGGASGD